MWHSPAITQIIRLALAEDLPAGDITSDLTIKPGIKGRAYLLAKEDFVICGLPLIERISAELPGGAPFKIRKLSEEGVRARRGDAIASFSGELRTILAAERTILNFIQRLSGIATHTAQVVKHAKGITVLDSRKTTPGLRVLEKYAVRTGGGKNHRFNLGDMILVKNNHIDANGGDLRKTLQRVMKGKPLYMPVEVEVRTIDELHAALEFKPEIILLDNMRDAEIRRALKVVAASGTSCMLEISGGVTAERLPALAKIGVTLVSMGTLITKATNADISLRIE